MSKIFISYRRNGGSILGQLLSYRLREDGHDVFFDTESMKAGRFDEQLLQNIQECDIFLSLLTENALDRCVDEGDFVFERRKSCRCRHKRVFVTVYCDESAACKLFDNFD